MFRFHRLTTKMSIAMKHMKIHSIQRLKYPPVTRQTRKLCRRSYGSAYLDARICASPLIVL